MPVTNGPEGKRAERQNPSSKKQKPGAANRRIGTRARFFCKPRAGGRGIIDQMRRHSAELRRRGRT